MELNSTNLFSLYLLEKVALFKQSLWWWARRSRYCEDKVRTKSYKWSLSLKWSSRKTFFSWTAWKMTEKRLRPLNALLQRISLNVNSAILMSLMADCDGMTIPPLFFKLKKWRSQASTSLTFKEMSDALHESQFILGTIRLTTWPAI